MLIRFSFYSVRLTTHPTLPSMAILKPTQVMWFDIKNGFQYKSGRKKKENLNVCLAWGQPKITFRSQCSFCVNSEWGREEHVTAGKVKKRDGKPLSENVF